jgi:hypothetical protein
METNFVQKITSQQQKKFWSQKAELTASHVPQLKSDLPATSNAQSVDSSYPAGESALNYLSAGLQTLLSPQFGPYLKFMASELCAAPSAAGQG